MKIAVIADPHANLVALKTAVEHIEAWKPDAVLVAGDIVNRGPRPKECLALILEKARTEGWRIVRGNHEDYVIDQARPGAPRDGPAAQVHQASIWTCSQLGFDVSALISMPFQQSMFGPDGREIRLVHASMLGNRDGVYPETTDEDLRKKIAPAGSSLAAFCTGHTHRSLVRSLDGTLVVNAGSSGLPFDGDRRLAYARLTFQRGVWQAEIVRLAYDIAAEQQDFYDNGYLEGGGPLVRLVQIELQTARSMLFNWAIKYQNRALAGEISVEESVSRYLQELGESQPGTYYSLGTSE